jgi:hypothetical protein
MIYSIPNVNPYNNVIYISNGVNEYPIVMDVAFYTPENLAEQLTDKLNTTTTAPGPAAGALGAIGWEVSYNPEFARFTIKNVNSGLPVPFKINPKYGQDKGTYNVVGETTSYSRTDTLATMMGFGNVPNALCVVNPAVPLPSPPTPAYCQWSGDVASMLYTTYIDVVSKTLTANQKVKDVSTNDTTGTNLLARIYISKNFENLDTETTIYGPDGTTVEGYNRTNNTYEVRPFYINYQPPYVKQVRWDDSIFLSSVSIRLQDDKGNLLYDFERNIPESLAGSNGYAQLTLLISESED